MPTEEQMDRLVNAVKARRTTTDDIISFGEGPDARQRAGQLVLDEAEYAAALSDAA